MEFYSYDALFSRKADDEYLRIPIELDDPNSEQTIVDMTMKETKHKGEFFMR